MTASNFTLTHKHTAIYSYVNKKKTNPKHFNVFKNYLNIKMSSKTISVFCISCSGSI